MQRQPFVVDRRINTKMNKKSILLISLALLILSQSLLGEDRKESKTNGFSLIPFVGYHFGYEFGKLLLSTGGYHHAKRCILVLHSWKYGNGRC